MPTIVKNFSDLDLTKTYTYSDYLLWQFSERVELIKGFILKMSPAPSRNHQTISQNLNWKIYSFFQNHSCSVYVAPFDVRLPIKSAKKNTTVVQPDLCIICDENKLDDTGCNGAPDLIVEILSPKNSKHDVDTKFNLYQESGVKEYWIVEPEEHIVLVYTLKDGEYIGSKPFSEGEIIKSILFPEMKIEVEDVFKKVK
ncbi:Uma2 family endonuclease [Flavobacterium nackdongense]|uniref:Uma2 family endonuclease n=1 Tax=Flavobacterium nackdongense TaxID=2547394 RepID=A0A4P6YDV5_9FLAO|nr:Uma2 family endonuclease [Flavobacterium nackdongense]QBN18573.1 Uma2 family endonuclease [Flavobacterium nackdongense]